MHKARRNQIWDILSVVSIFTTKYVFTKSLVSSHLTISLMPKWLQIQHILVIFDRAISLVDYNRPIVFLFAASRSFESLLRMSEYFGNTSSLMCCVLGALHLVLGLLLYVRVVAGVFFYRSVVERKLACFQWKLGSHVVRSLSRLGAYSFTDIDCSFHCVGLFLQFIWCLLSRDFSCWVNITTKI